MFGRRSPEPVPEEASVAPVEYLLDLSATRRTPAAPSADGLANATYALWICACVCEDDAPTWLIYEGRDGQVWWDRVPEGIEVQSLVDAEFSAGGHADPGVVLDWLLGKAAGPWGSGDGSGDDNVLEALGRTIRRTG